MKTILVTGGAGYIGSHVCKALKKAGYTPVTFDNLKHGHKWAVQWGPLFEGDILSDRDIEKALQEYKIEAAIHLAGSIHLRESIEDPASHYENNLIGSLTLFRTLIKHGITRCVFSSSAAVYKEPSHLPMDESHVAMPLNPYGQTKWMTEQVLKDFDEAYGLRSVSLRYFNAAGADPEGEIGEAHNPETHLIPRILLSTLDDEVQFTLFNQQLDTPDGTAVRDYVHVSDLASAHVKALEWLEQNAASAAFNLGTGRGYSVREVLTTVEKVTGKKIHVNVEKKIIKELPILIADPSKANRELGWTPVHSSLEEIIKTAWSWHTSRAPQLV